MSICALSASSALTTDHSPHPVPGAAPLTGARRRTGCSRLPQDVDRPDLVQLFTVPVRLAGLRVDRDAGRLQMGQHRREGRTVPPRGGRRDRERPAVGTPEACRAVGLKRDGETFLMHRAVVPSAEPNQVVEPGWTARRPVLDVMGVAVARLWALEDPCRMTTVEASHARRRDVPAGTRRPSIPSSADCPGALLTPLALSASSFSSSASTLSSTCTTTWVRDSGRSAARKLSSEKFGASVSHRRARA